MQKTPIKIRGKKASARTSGPGSSSVQTILDSDPKGKHSLSPSPRSSARVPYQAITTIQHKEPTNFSSCLERLPTELLETIFSYSWNVSLPQASLAIGQKLASTHVKRRLVLTVLSAHNRFDDNFQLEGCYASREHALLQSAVLRLRWVTWQFLREMIPDYIVDTIIGILGALGLPWMGSGPVVSKESEPLLREYLSDNAARFNHTKEPGSPAYWEHQWYDKSCHIQVTLGVGLRDGIVTLHHHRCPDYGHMSCFPHYTKNPSLFTKWSIISGVDGCQIPEKLLHGPWTDEKCTFLEVLTRERAQIDSINSTSGEVAELGLWGAISERNARAIKALVGEPVPANPDDLDIEFLPEVTKNTGLIHTDYFPCPGVGIRPRQEHLQKVVLENHPREVILALLQAKDTDFDPTEIYDTYVLGNEKG